MHYPKQFTGKDCVDCKVELVAECPVMITGPIGKFRFGNPELWAESTLSDSHDFEDLVQVYEIKADKLRKYVRERIWLHDILDDNNIPYKVEFVGFHSASITGRKSRMYSEKQYIFVEKKHKKEVLKFIKEYNNLENIVEEDITNDDTNNLPQVKCSACGKEIDFDFLICPFCKKQL